MIYITLDVFQVLGILLQIIKMCACSYSAEIEEFMVDVRHVGWAC